MSESARATRRAQAAQASYGRAIRGIVRQFWAGRLDFDQAFNLMIDGIRVGLRNNWFAGAAECGIQPSEQSPEERQTMEARIVEEQSHIATFLTAIEGADKAAGAKLGPQLERAKAWTLRATDVQNQARTLACSDKKLKWIQGPTSDGCKTCTRMDGKVKRGSVWERVGVHPQHPPNPTIECEGHRCLCELRPTNEPLSRGSLPRFP